MFRVAYVALVIALLTLVIGSMQALATPQLAGCHGVSAHTPSYTKVSSTVPCGGDCPELMTCVFHFIPIGKGTGRSVGSCVCDPTPEEVNGDEITSDFGAECTIIVAVNGGSRKVRCEQVECPKPCNSQNAPDDPPKPGKETTLTCICP